MGLRVIFILLAIIHFVCCRPCSISEDGKRANCSERHLTQIPVLSNQTEVLDLSGNNFTTLTNSSFKHLPQLETLNISRCHVHHLDGQVFASLGYLHHLSLSQNMINILHERFQHLRFHNNPFLKHLDLSFNTRATLKQIDSVYPDQVFASLSSVEDLILDLLPNPVFGEGFSNMTNVRSLIFQDCTIMHLKNETFKYFINLTKLTFLQMSNCQVHIEPWVKVEPAVLQYFHSLESLDLSRTMITFPVAMDMLYGLTMTKNQSYHVRHMKLLNIYNVNPLILLWMYDVSYAVKVTKSMTKYFRHLCIEDINIGKNGIVEFDVEALANLKHISCLRRFILRENNFLFAFPKYSIDIMKLFYHAVNLQEIDYSYMAIQFSNNVGNQFPNFAGNVNNQYLDPNAYHTEIERHLSLSEIEQEGCMIPISSKNLSHMRMSHLLFPFNFKCSIDVSKSPKLIYVDISYMTITDMDFKVKGASLSYLDVSGISFGYSGSRFLGSLLSVRKLVIRDADLDRAFSNGNYIFRNVNHIDEIDMSSNHLNTLPKEALEGLECLQKITLTQNFLSEFPRGLFEMTNLTHIDIRYNKLLSLDKPARDWLDDRPNITLLLDGNRFTCTCDTAEFVSWIMTKVKLHRKPSNYKCMLKDGSVTNIKYVYDNRDTYFRNCNDHLFWLQFSISAISLLLLAIVISVVCYQYRWRILYYFYRNCKIKPGLEDITTYNFDLFVAYTAADSPWIWQQLRPKLELQHNIQLCLHERDFEVGESISQNIVNCLQKSKKILFVISAEYINARWCDFELEMANMERVQRGCTNSIIVAIKGEIPADGMPRLVRNIWQHVTCIIYPLDKTDMDAFELFWCRLHHSIIS
ncbi:toll-like receptor 4 [Ylistrum balloti]|uniref:toll-like receptor 4 n=1 Tax=Ylistrum balloti TaxID=509963 RepID=UPI002905E2FF|nr:toll-like receptor 4 [Ylistrum balloti]